jgi:hypothetical protein
MAAGLTRLLAFLAIALAVVPNAQGVAAEVLVDPTRPPASIVAGESGEAPRRPVLQSIIITPRSRAAIIDDERVQLHGKFRDAVVAQISETEVVLKSAAGIETLKMYPGIDKTAARRDAPRITIERKSGNAAGDRR